MKRKQAVLLSMAVIVAAAVVMLSRNTESPGLEQQFIRDARGDVAVAKCGGSPDPDEMWGQNLHGALRRAKSALGEAMKAREETQTRQGAYERLGNVAAAEEMKAERARIDERIPAIERAVAKLTEQLNVNDAKRAARNPGPPVHTERVVPQREAMLAAAHATVAAAAARQEYGRARLAQAQEKGDKEAVAAAMRVIEEAGEAHVAAKRALEEMKSQKALPSDTVATVRVGSCAG